MGRLGRGYVALRAMRVVRGTVVMRGDVVLYVIIFDTQCISSYLKKISKYENVKNAKTYVIDIVYVVYT